MTRRSRPEGAGRGVEVRPARRDADVGRVRALFREYADGVGVDLGFESFEAEVAALPGVYAEPRGVLLLAWQGDRPVGATGVRPYGPSECELKRLYVRPEARGLGAGRRLVVRALEFGRGAGYVAMRLDSLPTMTAALALYPRLGFVEVPPERPNPIPGTRYFVRSLLTELPPDRA